MVNEVHALNRTSYFKEKIKRIGLIPVRKKTNAIFVLSKNAKKILSEMYGFNEEIIYFTPNGIENKEIEPFVFGQKSHFTYAYGGTLYDWQGINILIEHSKEILNIADDIRIKIIGGGPMYDDVKNFILRNNLQDRIMVTGFIKEHDYIKELKSADVLLIPRPSYLSTETAIPLKIFDAIKVSKPIIMSNVSGLTEVLSDEEALIYPHTNTSLLVDCCRKIYRNNELAFKLSDAASNRLKTWPTNFDIAKKQIQVIENLFK